MVARLRIIGAFLALFAFGSAEAATAMAFAPSEAAATANCMSDMADSCAHGSHGGGGDGATGDCPSMPAGMTGACTTAVALHEARLELRAFSPRQPLLEKSDDLPAPVLPRRLFRPPRA